MGILVHEKETILGNIMPSRKYAHHLFREIFERDCYGLEKLSSEKFDAVYDLGANIGMFSIAASRFFLNSRICCFEPVCYTLSCLRHNISCFAPSVEVFDCGVGAEKGSFDVYSNNFWADATVGFLRKEFKPVTEQVLQPEKAKLEKIDTIIEMLSPKKGEYLLKIDVEGGERHIFASQVGMDFIRNSKYAMLEVHCFKKGDKKELKTFIRNAFPHAYGTIENSYGGFTVKIDNRVQQGV